MDGGKSRFKELVSAIQKLKFHFILGQPTTLIESLL
jgi:hypothetical protein